MVEKSYGIPNDDVPPATVQPEKGVDNSRYPGGNIVTSGQEEDDKGLYDDDAPPAVAHSQALQGERHCIFIQS
jgi:hypothetical protein